MRAQDPADIDRPALSACTMTAPRMFVHILDASELLAVRTSLKSFLQNSSRYGSISNAYTWARCAQYTCPTFEEKTRGAQITHSMPMTAHDESPL